MFRVEWGRLVEVVSLIFGCPRKFLRVLRSFTCSFGLLGRDGRLLIVENL